MTIERVDMMKELLAKNPKQGDIWFLLGHEYAALNQKNDAIEAFAQALIYCDEEAKLKISGELAKLAAAPDAAEPSSLSQDLLPIEPQKADGTSKILPFRVITGKGKKTAAATAATAAITFRDVGGLTENKDAIRLKIIDPFVRPALFRYFKKKVGGGILLYGPPGCGKTYLAKATAGECQAYFKPVHITDILSKYIGDSEQNIKDIFDTARSHKPCILFFDEIDSIGFNRARLSSEHLRPVIDQFLTEIEGIDSNTDHMLIIGATNMPWDVDSAFKRPGRFDKSLFIPPPDLEARAVIFQLKLSERPTEAIDYMELAQHTDLYSGADIENVVEVATESVIAEIMQTNQERSITMGDMLSAVEKTQPSTLEWLRTIRNYVKYANQTGLYDDVEHYLRKIKKSL